MTRARNRAIDRLRRKYTLAAKSALLVVPEMVANQLNEKTIPDERLELIFPCCHPALAIEAQVALPHHRMRHLRLPTDGPSD